MREPEPPGASQRAKSQLQAIGGQVASHRAKQIWASGGAVEAVDGVEAFDLRLYTIFSYGVRLFPIHFLHTLHLFLLTSTKKRRKRMEHCFANQ